MRIKDKNKEERILNTALMQIARQGIAGLRMQVLAKESGLATGTVYLYFPDKTALLQALYRVVAVKMQKSIWGEDTRTGSLEARLRQRWYNYLRYVQSFPAEIIFMEQYHRSPFYTASEEQPNQQSLQPLLELLQAGVHSGELRHCQPALHLAFLCGTIQEIVAWSEYGDLPAISDITHHVWEMTWNALKKH